MAPPQLTAARPRRNKPAAGRTTVTLTTSLSSLTASTTYHYRFVASNSLGTSYGADKTFTTSASGGAGADGRNRRAQQRQFHYGDSER